jgi:hypothetical protein
MTTRKSAQYTILKQENKKKRAILIDHYDEEFLPDSLSCCLPVPDRGS